VEIQSFILLISGVEENVTCLEHFTTEIVVEGVVKCISLIKPDAQLNHHLPPNLSARYKLCMDIAKACKDIGFKDDLGYETFLHGGPIEIRKVLIVLINKLPKANEQPIPEKIDSFQHTLNEIRKEMQVQLNRPWVPHFCRKCENKCEPFHSIDISHKIYQSGNDAFSRLSSIPGVTLVPSLLEKHSSDLALEKYHFKFPTGSKQKENETEVKTDSLSTRFSLLQLFHHSDLTDKRKIKPLLPPKPTHLGGVEKTKSAVATKEEQSLKLSSELEILQQDLELRQQELTALDEEVFQMKQTIEHKKTVIDADSKELERKEKLYSLLPEAPMHLKRIEALLESSQKKMALLEHEWEDIKQPLEDEYQCLLQTHNNSAAQQQKAAFEQTAQCLRQVVEEIHSKEESITRLESQLDAMPSSALTRSFYTQRILSIVANVKKQNQEMQRVIGDVKSVQRENNSLLGKVERTFTVTDEMIFRMAQTDETARRIYKYLISLHSDCNEILRLVEEAGTLSREIKALEEQNETESRKNTRSKLKQMQSDLEQIRCENQTMERARSLNK